MNFEGAPRSQFVRYVRDHKGGCLRRPRAARRMLPAASTVLSASLADCASRGFTWGCYEDMEIKRIYHLLTEDREPQPYQQQQDARCSSPSGPAGDPPCNFITMIKANHALIKCESNAVINVLSNNISVKSLGQLWKFWPQCETSSYSSSGGRSLAWVQHINIKAEIVIVWFKQVNTYFCNCNIESET